MKSIANFLLSLVIPEPRKSRIYIDSATFDPNAAPRQGNALIMTARNEERTIYGRVKSALCESAGVVVIDQGSTDNTASRAAQAGAIVVLQDEGVSSAEAKKKAVRAAKHYSSNVQFVEN